MEKLLIKIGRSYHFIDESNVEIIRADRNYSRIFCGEKSFLVRRSLRALEEKLNSNRFMRINKSTIVNVEMINYMRETDDNNYEVVLNNDEIIRWGRKYRENLLRLIKI